MQNKFMPIIIVILILILGIQGFLLYQVTERVNQFEQPWSMSGNQALIPQIRLPDSNAWNPYDEFQKMQKEMDKLFSNSYSRFHLNSPIGSFSKSPDLDFQDKPSVC